MTSAAGWYPAASSMGLEERLAIRTGKKAVLQKRSRLRIEKEIDSEM